MSDGRTVWWSKDAAWWRREWIVELGEEFGAGGPAVIDWLWCEAKAQNAGGWVKTGPKAIARGCFVDVVTVGHVLSRSVTLGLLDEFSDERGRFSCRLSGYQSDQERAQATARKAKQRAVNKGNSPVESRNGHGESRSVPKCPPTGQNRTVVPASQVNTLRSDVVECFEYWRDRCKHPNAKLTAPRQSKVQARRKEGYSVAQIRQGIDGAALNPPRDRDSGVVHDDLESVCRSGAQLERYIGRATARGFSGASPLHPVGRENASDWLREMDVAAGEGEAS